MRAPTPRPEGWPTCEVEGCDRPAKSVQGTKYARRRCSKHEKDREAARNVGTCEIPGCDSHRWQARRYCRWHATHLIGFPPPDRKMVRCARGHLMTDFLEDGSPNPNVIHSYSRPGKPKRQCRACATLSRNRLKAERA